MTELAWKTVRDQTVKTFTEIPRADTEQEIVERFQAQPELVMRLIDQLSEERHKGQIRSCWAVLRSRLHDHGPTSNPTVDTSHNRDKLVRSAEAWIRNAGYHNDRESELLNDLGFTITLTVKGQTIEHDNPTGKLYAYRDDEALRDRMLQLWHTLRPADEKVEEEAEQRGKPWHASTQLEQQIKRKKQRETTAAPAQDDTA